VFASSISLNKTALHTQDPLSSTKKASASQESQAGALPVHPNEHSQSVAASFASALSTQLQAAGLAVASHS
jgi:hypothetical protein